MAQLEISPENMGLAAELLSPSVRNSIVYDGTHANGSDAAIAALSGIDLAPARKASLLAYCASKRWQKETGGIEIGGMSIATDRESQSMINGAYNMAKENAAFTTKFKTQSGFQTIDAETIITVAVAVGAHVAACFAAEADATADINSGEMTTRQHVDAAFDF